MTELPPITKKELMSEIDICLQRKDLTNYDFIYLHGLKLVLNKTSESLMIVSFVLGSLITMLLFILGFIICTYIGY